MVVPRNNDTTGRRSYCCVCCSGQSSARNKRVCKQQFVIGIIARNGICQRVRHSGIESCLFFCIQLVACPQKFGQRFEETQRESKFTPLAHLCICSGILNALRLTSHIRNTLPTSADNCSDFAGKTT